MLISAGLAKKIFAQSLHIRHHSSYLMSGSGLIGIARTESGQGVQVEEKVWHGFLPLTLSGVVWYG